MVAVVGRPAERQLRQVAGADNHSVLGVRKIHKYFGALARLTVFIDHVVVALVVSDVPEVLLDGSRDVDYA